MPYMMPKNWTADHPPKPGEIISQFQAAVEEADVMAPPLLLVWVHNTVGVLPPMGDPAVLLANLAAQCEFNDLARPTWLVFASEAYNTLEPGYDTLRPGELAERAAAGRRDVGESVLAHMVHHDGRSWSARQAFQRVPALRTVQWGGREITESRVRLPIRDDVFEVMRMIVNQPDETPAETLRRLSGEGNEK